MATVLEAKQTQKPQATMLSSTSQRSMGHSREQCWNPWCMMKIKLKSPTTNLHLHVQMSVAAALRQQVPGSSEDQLSTKISSLYRIISSQTSSGWETTALFDATLSESEKYWQINKSLNDQCAKPAVHQSNSWKCSWPLHTARQTLPRRARGGAGRTTVYHVSPFIRCLLESSLVPTPWSH